MEDLNVPLEAEVSLYANFQGKRASENLASTIPDSKIVTAARPDIVLIKDKTVVLLELTIAHNSSDKRQKYQRALSDLEAREFVAALHTIEISTLRHWEHSCRKAI